MSAALRQWIPVKPGSAVSLPVEAGRHYVPISELPGKALPREFAAVRRGKDLVITWGDGTSVTLEEFYLVPEGQTVTVEVTSQYGPATLSSQTAGTLVADGIEVVHVEGSTDALMRMALADRPDLLASVLPTPVAASTATGISGWALPGWGLSALGAAGVAVAVGSGNGGGSDDASPSEFSDGTITGRVSIGAVRSGHSMTIKAMAADGSRQLAMADVADDGTYRIVVGQYRGPIVLIVQGLGVTPDYTDAATGEARALSSPLMAVTSISVAALDINVNVNIVTTLGALEAGVALDGSVTRPVSTSAVDAANTRIGQAFGLTDITGAVSTPPIDATGAVQSADSYGRVLAALEGIEESLGIGLAETVKRIDEGLVTTGNTTAITPDLMDLIVEGAANAGVPVAAVTGTLDANADDRAGALGQTLESGEIQALTPTVAAALTPAQTASISDPRPLPERALAALSPEALVALRPEALGMLTQSQVNALGDDQLRALMASGLLGSLNVSVTLSIEQLTGASAGTAGGGLGMAAIDSVTEASLVNSALRAATPSLVDTAEDLDQLADIAERVLALARGESAMVTADEFGRLGVPSNILTPDRHTQLLSSLAGAGESAADTVEEIANRIDVLPPSVTLTPPVDTQLTAAQATAFQLQYAAGDGVGSGVAGAAVVVRNVATGINIDINVTITANTVSGDFSSLPDGAYAIDVAVTDAAGNIRTQTQTVVVDKTAPTVNFPVPVDTQLAQGQTASFSTPLTVNDSGTGITASGVTVTRQDGTIVSVPVAVVDNQLSANLSALPDGNYRVQVSATDAAGNVSVQEQAIIVDQTAPTLSFDLTTDIVLTFPDATNFTLGITVVDTVSGVVSVSATVVDSDGRTVDSVSLIVENGLIRGDLSSLENGQYEVRVQSVDSAGNVSSASRPLSVDKSPPLLTLSSLADALLSSEELPGFSLDFTVLDQTGGSGLQSIEANILGLNGQAIPPLAISTTGSRVLADLAALADGLYSLEVSATDVAGNVTTRSQTLTVDGTDPTVSLAPLTDVALSLTQAQSYSQAYSASDAGTGLDLVDARVLSASGVLVSDSLLSVINDQVAGNLGSLASGAYLVQVLARDEAGNETTRTQSIQIDRDAPSLTVTALTDRLLTSAQAAAYSQAFTASDSGGSLSYTTTAVLLNGASQPVGGVVLSTLNNQVSANLSGLSAGQYSVVVTTTDEAGNSTVSTQLPMTLDFTAPTLALTPLTDTLLSLTQAQNFSQSMTVADAGTGISSVQVQLVGGPGNPSGQGTVISGVPLTASGTVISGDLSGVNNGAYVMRVTALDAAGNSTQVEQAFSVDKQPPSLVLTTLSDRFLTAAQALAYQQTYSISDSGGSASVTTTAVVRNSLGSDMTGVAISTTGGVINGNLSGLDDGTYSVVVTSTDSAGNTVSQTQSGILIDKVLPALSVPSLSASLRTLSFSEAQSFSLSFTATDASGTPTTRVDFIDTGGVTRQTYSTSGSSLFANISGLTAGAYIIRVTSTDIAGNTRTVDVQDPDNPSRSFLYDPSVPEVTLTSGSFATTGSATVSATEASSIYLVRTGTSFSSMASFSGINDGLWNTVSADANVTTSLPLTGLLPGQYRAYAFDSAGNVSTASTGSILVTNTVDAARIDIGTPTFPNVQLILPVYADGGWYMALDVDNNGVITSADQVNHSDIEQPLRFLSDFSTANPASDGITLSLDHAYRFGLVNNVRLALPRFGDAVTATGQLPSNEFGALQPGSSIDNIPMGETNPLYDDLLAIWDAFNGAGTGTGQSGVPTGWASTGTYLTATPDGSTRHAGVNLSEGRVVDLLDTASGYVVLQVL